MDAFEMAGVTPPGSLSVEGFVLLLALDGTPTVHCDKRAFVARLLRGFIPAAVLRGKRLTEEPALGAFAWLLARAVSVSGPEWTEQFWHSLGLMPVESQIALLNAAFVPRGAIDP
jgi:hypothetical protein